MKKAERNPVFGFVFLGAVLILLAALNLYFGSVYIRRDNRRAFREE